MELNDLQGKLVAVLGYGLEGRAVASYLLKQGVKPVLFDEKPWAEWPADEQGKIKLLGINFIFGPDCFKELKGFDVAFRSPGIKISQLKTNNLQLTSQTKWFFDHCPAKIIGVTGTKGKGTTASLIFGMLSQKQSQRKNKQFRAFLTGNIGKDQPLDFLEQLMPDDWIVYELSSFQLQDLEKSPHIAVVLMVTGEHLDYHPDIAGYREAKTPITKFQTPQDFAIINRDYPASIAIGAFGKGKKLFFSQYTKVSEGCFIKNDSLVTTNSKFTFPIQDLQLKGRHNLENVCAATLAAFSAGCPGGSVKKTLKEFKGLEHRLEFVTEKDGIYFYNDSFSTTPETAMAAIKSFTEPLILILGGSSKNSDFESLAHIIEASKNIKTIILVGQEEGKIKDALKGRFAGAILTGAKNMEEIFSQVKTEATFGDVVLLSPACASFDMFKNYQDRGQQFKANVKKW